ncbi:aldo/keto reductase [Petrachloros mirabilis]
MTSGSSSGRPNRLIHETSPYLLQHAHNPVDWYPWGPEALRLAKEQNKPILLSIGYSACHWCHVMERESFENEATAAIMNRHFVCIKVDREERPDLDEIYMAATVVMNNGQGGWPMTVFLTPEQQPFFAGTYFPPEDRWGRPGFPTLLKKIANAWEADPAGLCAHARELTERLKREWQAPAPISINESVFENVVEEFHQEFDARFGGFGSAPKFPPAAGLSLLLRCYRKSRDTRALEMVRTTLDGMAAGGIYDHIGGGFARYSTDERWLVPHFEKMLYDNALLARTYLEAYVVTTQPSYRQVVTEVLDYILREMTDAEGGFYSATDADSEGIEGKFFVWTPHEVHAVLHDDEDTRRFNACYDITEQGNWEHTNIPNRMKPIDLIAKELDIIVDELRETIRRVRPLLYEARKQRVPPGLDDKIITAWNGMMISAMAEGGRVLGVSRYIETARAAADFLLRVHRQHDGRLFRTSRRGRAHLEAVLEDYAYLGEGLIDLYEACGDTRYLANAEPLADHLLQSFHDRDLGGFYTTAKDRETLIVRGREGADGATPSGNAVAASFLARLSFHFDRQDWREAATGALRAYGKQMTRYPRAFAKSLSVVDFLMEGPIELALIGRKDDPGLKMLQWSINKSYLPNRIIAISDTLDGSSRHPLLAGKKPVDGRAALYVCRNFTCQHPVTDPEAVADALQSVSRPPVLADREKRLQGKMLPGSASVEATGRYAARQVNNPQSTGNMEHGFGPFGATGLTASKLGFGCYRVDRTNPEFGAALGNSLRSGVNVVDTSTNYMDGESERLVGSVLRQEISANGLSREEVIIVSKIGYIQGENLKQAQAREQSGRPYPEMVKYGEGIWHCIHPEFLVDQLDASLDRLGLETLDICLLHNPEYFLSEAAQHSRGTLAERRDEFYTRIERAFAYLESQVKQGRIRWYGVSSNTVAGEASSPETTSLSEFLDMAMRASCAQGFDRHHFAVIQFPMNLFESEGWSRPNTGTGQRETVLQLAQRERLAVLVNRPLNAMPKSASGMIRLAEFPVENDPIDIDKSLEKLETLEHEYRSVLAPAIPSGGEGTKPAEFFRWAEELRRVRPHTQGLEHWEQIEHQMIAPQINQVLQGIPRLLTGDTLSKWHEWRDRYLPVLLTLLGGLRREATDKSLARIKKVTSAIDPLIPPDRCGESLSRKALWILTSTPGVTTVLNGMRTIHYVEDSVGVLGWKPLDDVSPIYQTLANGSF